MGADSVPLKMTNGTRYDSAFLRKLVICGIRHGAKAQRRMEKLQGEHQMYWQVRVSYSKKPRVGGLAWLHGHAFDIYLPHIGCLTEVLYRVIFHEVRHCVGERHKQMAAWYNIVVPPAVLKMPEVLRERG